MAIQKFLVNGDEAKIDYEGLENKPFGEESIETILNEETGTFIKPSEILPYMYTIVAFVNDIVLGETYTVSFDGTEYTCVASEGYFMGAQALLLGNLTIASPVPGPGEPFCVVSNDNAKVIMGVSAGPHTFSIVKRSVSTINPEYLPEYLQYGSKNYVIVCDDTYAFEAGGSPK